MKLGIIQKLTLGLALILLIVASGTGIFFSERESEQRVNALNDQAGVVARLAGAAAEAGLTFDDTDAVDTSLRPFQLIEGLDYIEIRTTNGTKFTTWERTNFEAQLAPDLTFKERGKSETTSNDNYIAAASPIKTSEGEVVGQALVAMSLEAIHAAEASGRQVTFTFGLGILVIGCAIFWFLTQRMLSPVFSMVSRLEDIAQGEADLTKRLEVETDDELGEMAQWFNTFADRLQETFQAVGSQAIQVDDQCQKVEALGGELQDNIRQTSDRSQQVSDGGNEVSANVEKASHGVSEMESSISEISQNIHEVSAVARTAVDEANKTTSTVAELEESSGKIDNVLKVISTIAEQTNLLALNATIEAARAGEAGKGFAVVANEVKDLAKETAKATDDVRKLVESIAASSHAAVDAIGNIGNIIRRIDDHQAAIAAAIEQQSATATSVSHTISRAKDVTTTIHESIRDVAANALENSEHSQHLRDSASEMATAASSMKAVISKFRY